MTPQNQYLFTLKNNWDLLAHEDPLWAILSNPKKRGKLWQTKQFFETGRQEIKELKTKLSRLGIKLEGKKALDFGCGVGRLTRALSEYFSEVYGLDISGQMITLAKKYNRKYKNCTFLIKSTNQLDIFTDSSFDFVYTNLTLQHIEPRYTKKYLAEFLRILKTNGILIFQLPSEYREPKDLPFRLRKIINSLAHSWNRSQKNLGQYIPMYGIKKRSVLRLIAKNGGVRIAIYPNRLAGPGWMSHWYFVKKVV